MRELTGSGADVTGSGADGGSRTCTLCGGRPTWSQASLCGTSSTARSRGRPPPVHS